MASILHSYWGRLYRGTPAELALEPAVASLGVPYRFQHPLFLWGTKIFPDYCWPTIGVVLEVDDPSHEEPEKMADDARKTAILEEMGYVVVRCTNAEATSNPYAVVDRIRPLLSRVGPGVPAPPRFVRKRRFKKKKRS